MSDAKPRNPRFHGRVPRDDGCQSPGCQQRGEFRAPMTPGGFDGPGDWRWLCLDHVREFNAGYNYFSGMTAEEIEASQRPFAGWERETRAFAGGGGDRAPSWSDFRDPLDAIQGRFGRRNRDDARVDGKPLSGDDRRALKILGLAVDADRRALRQRYSELVRRYHPDRNGGNRAHEAELQRVVEAYNALKSSRAFA